MTNAGPLILDKSYLVAYENDLTRRPQDVVLQAITDARVLLVPATSLAAAAADLDGQHPELSWLFNDDQCPVQILALSGANALEVGASVSDPEKATLAAIATAHVVHEADAINAIVLTYAPDQYVGRHVHVADMRPQ